ncbi:MAG: nucleoside kinase, partial [Anaerovoracaceae bacterium]
VEIAQAIQREEKRIILIAGPSSSGKTTFARRLAIQLKVNGLKPIYLGTDDYFINREDMPLDKNGEKDFEGFDALEIDLFNKNMNALLAGEVVDIPEFDFIEGKKKFGNRITSIKHNQPIIVEGIHALNGRLTEQIPDRQIYKIYISPLTQLAIDEYNRIPTTDARIFRRMVRDYKYRGHDAQGTIKSWPKVRAGEDKNIFPYNGEADAFFNSAHIYELAVLKKYAEPLLKKIKETEPEYSEAVRLLKFLEFFNVLEEEQVIANNSIIREFIGGSVFVEE